MVMRPFSETAPEKEAAQLPGGIAVRESLVSFVRPLRYLRFLLLNPNAWVFEQEVTEATEEALAIRVYP